MSQRHHKITALLLLVTWPTMIGLATGWHVHAHAEACEDSEFVVTHDEHHHGHSHHHHGHHGHSHHHHASQDPVDDSSPCPSCPHDSENCSSCQILALTGTVTTVTLPIIEVPSEPGTIAPLHSLVSAECPSCFHLRGPPVSFTV